MVEGRRPAGGKASSNARPGLSAGYGVPPKLRACGLGVHGPPKPRTSIALDLRQEPGAGKPHAGICAGGPGQPGPLPLQPCGAPPLGGVREGCPFWTAGSLVNPIENACFFCGNRRSHFRTPGELSAAGLMPSLMRSLDGSAKSLL